MPRNFFEQFDNLGMPKIVLNEVKNHNQRSEVIKKSINTDLNSKALLIAELQDVLKLLANVNDQEISQKGKQFKDPIIQQLQNLQKRATANQFKEIQKLCMLAIGKRILNIELKKKRQQFAKKQQKKSEIQEFFRQNRIKKFDYDSVIEEKLAINTLIVRPYTSGKGFIESGNDYTQMHEVLIDCDYINVVREVNRIFFDIFSGKKKDRNDKINELIFKIIWIPVAIFLAIILTLPFYSFNNYEIILSVLLGLIVILLSFVTVSTYLNVPNSNNQMQQSIEDTKKYFSALNAKNETEGKQYRWICPQNFMYLEVKFDYDITQRYRI